ncbi:FGGY-family carbohydrate kinase [Actinocatenispora comari]|uniref:Carbohydrate kinase n=1 Tax=Actinocatenispora comari TaxID=2807577 RepID=A0A8J4AG61_9ACTN|nr:FGGY family carbohydrate kinase [Actinocatenispora comari]GIL30674.1 carbohydrate kinase [Actinocatenispora comari]
MAETQPSPNELWAGVDVGTQSVRVTIVDETGATRATGSAPLTSTRTGGRHEQDPDQWWQAFRRASREAVGALPTGAAAGIRGLAIDATSGTFLLADRDGTPRTPGLMYDDGRAGAEVADVLAAGAGLWDRLGYAMQRSWALPKLVWLLRHDATLRADATAGRLRLVHQADHLAARLTGGPVATDHSHALKTGYDLDAERWPTDVLARLDVPADLLPAVVRPGSTLGAVDRAAAEQTGLPAGLPVRAGMTDGCAAQLAAGALTEGSWNAILGTTLVLKGVTAQRLTDPGGAVYSHRHPDGGWLPGGASSSGAGAIAAAYPGLGATELDALAERAAGYEPAGALRYPVATLGERFPFVDPTAEPFLVGSLADDADGYAALLQGVGYVERLCYAYLRSLGARTDGPVTLTGGGARSRYWCQLRADILGRPLRVPRDAEPAVGMAVLAAAGTGSVAATAARMARPYVEVEPRAGGPERFAEPYREFVAELHRRGSIGADLLAAADSADLPAAANGAELLAAGGATAAGDRAPVAATAGQPGAGTTPSTEDRA